MRYYAENRDRISPTGQFIQVLMRAGDAVTEALQRGVPIEEVEKFIPTSWNNPVGLNVHAKPEIESRYTRQDIITRTIRCIYSRCEDLTED